MSNSDAAGDQADFDRKVLKDFSLPNARLKDIPRQPKKKLVIYRHITEQFEPGRRYNEAEVNEVIRRFHEDYATIRRGLIEHGLMAREAGQYWRPE